MLGCDFTAIIHTNIFGRILFDIGETGIFKIIVLKFAF